MSNFQETMDEARDLSPLMNVTYYRTPHSNQAILTLQGFINWFYAQHPNSPLISSEVNVVFKTPDDYDPDNLYYSSKVCYEKTESKDSNGKPYENPKINTYRLCPICNPFRFDGTKSNQVKNKKREGINVSFTASEPEFYDSLHTQYNHHMAQVHGIFKDGSGVEQPFVALQETSPNDFEIMAICPCLNENSGKHCRWETSTRHKARNAPLKSYFRHFDSYHCPEKMSEKKRKKQRVSEPPATERFYEPYSEKGVRLGVYPVCMHDFDKTWVALQKKLGGEVIPEIFHYNSSPHITNSSSNNKPTKRRKNSSSDGVSRKKQYTEPQVPLSRFQIEEFTRKVLGNDSNDISQDHTCTGLTHPSREITTETYEINSDQCQPNIQSDFDCFYTHLQGDADSFNEIQALERFNQNTVDPKMIHIHTGNDNPFNGDSFLFDENNDDSRFGF